MTVICPTCREVVHVFAGYIVRHGARHHLTYDLCIASGTPYSCTIDCCS